MECLLIIIKAPESASPVLFTSGVLILVIVRKVCGRSVVVLTLLPRLTLLRRRRRLGRRASAPMIATAPASRILGIRIGPRPGVRILGWWARGYRVVDGGQFDGWLTLFGFGVPPFQWPAAIVVLIVIASAPHRLNLGAHRLPTLVRRGTREHLLGRDVRGKSQPVQHTLHTRRGARDVAPRRPLDLAPVVIDVDDEVDLLSAGFYGVLPLGVAEPQQAVLVACVARSVQPRRAAAGRAEVGSRGCALAGERYRGALDGEEGIPGRWALVRGRELRAGVRVNAAGQEEYAEREREPSDRSRKGWNHFSNHDFTSASMG